MNLMLGDCLQRMLEIPDSSVDIVVCDLPYGSTDCEWDSVIDLEAMWLLLNQKVKDKGKIILTASNPFASVLVCSNISNFLYSWVWDKGNAGNFQQVKYRPLKVTEDVLIFQARNEANNALKKEFSATIRRLREDANISLKEIGERCGERWYFKGGFKYFETGVTEPTEKQYLALKSVLCVPDKFDNMFGDIKYFPQGVRAMETPKVLSNVGKGGKLMHINSTGEYTQTLTGYPKNLLKFNRETGLHPTQKPVTLMEYLINTYSDIGDTVLDMTMGSGTTGVACKNLNRHFIGIEKDEEYFEIAKKRIEAA